MSSIAMISYDLRKERHSWANCAGASLGAAAIVPAVVAWRLDNTVIGPAAAKDGGRRSEERANLEKLHNSTYRYFIRGTTKLRCINEPADSYHVQG